MTNVLCDHRMTMLLHTAGAISRMVMAASLLTKLCRQRQSDIAPVPAPRHR